MATNRTEQYGLHLWEPGDDFLREEFNENTLAVEAALGEKVEVVFGSYTGDNTANRVISLGFTPKCVILVNHSGQIYAGADIGGGVFFPEMSLTNFTIVDGGFRVSNEASYGGSTNNRFQHFYLAFR